MSCPARDPLSAAARGARGQRSYFLQAGLVGAIELGAAYAGIDWAAG